jgi:uncharacterized protein
MKDILIFSLLMLLVSGVGWLGQWGRTNDIARYGVLTMIGVSGAGLMLLGSLVLLVVIFQPSAIPNPAMIFASGCMMGLMGFMAIPSMIPPIRRWLGQTVFPGLDASVPAHTWALYVYLMAMCCLVVLITWLYNPDAIIQSLKGVPLFLTAISNAAIFVVFSFIAAGVGIYQSPGEVMKSLGLGPLNRTTVLKLIGFALVLAIAIQILEWMLMPLVDPHMREVLNRIVNSLQTHGSVQQTLLAGVFVGLSAGIGEEILFRGLLQPVFGIVPTAILFTLIHVHYGPTVLLLELFIVGVILGVIRQRLNTTAAIIVHAGFDFFAITSSLFTH